jgi:uncharacterized membrane protein YobD (UPF0266 family)
MGFRMNNYAFFKKKQDIKKKQDKDFLDELIFLAQVMWLMQVKNTQSLQARARMHQLTCYFMFKRFCRMHKLKLKKEVFWYEQIQHDHSRFYEFKL